VQKLYTVPTKNIPSCSVRVWRASARQRRASGLGSWITSLALAFEVRIYWLPTHASWRDQVEIIFSKVQRDVLTPNDFPSTLALEKQLKTYFDALNRHPKPMQWTYTKTKLLAKFGTSQPAELAA
jgi:hypothetical protein